MKPRKLIENLADLDCPQCFTTGSWSLPVRARKRDNSITAVARCEACGERVFLKRIIRAEHGSVEAQAQYEFDVTSILYKAFSDSSRRRVVRPLARLGTLLVFEFVNGSPLTKMLRRGRRIAPLTDLMAETGIWFSEFHEIGGVTYGGVDLGHKLEMIKVRCVAEGLGSPTTAKALAYMTGLLDDISGSTLPHVRLHGDAKPDNFLLSGQELIGIDVDWRYRNLAEYDLAQFLIQFSALRAGFLSRQVQQQELENAFLEEYQRRRQVDMGVLVWLRIYYFLSFWLSWRKLSIVHRAYWDPFFRHRLGDYLQQVR